MCPSPCNFWIECSSDYSWAHPTHACKPFVEKNNGATVKMLPEMRT
uniref:Uncharacterized protein n=1 Tax=Rhizophora mucronata TaxID=61149 RepID=A0A2P2QXP5_RHIMU